MDYPQWVRDAANHNSSLEVQLQRTRNMAHAVGMGGGLVTAKSQKIKEAHENDINNIEDAKNAFKKARGSEEQRKTFGYWLNMCSTCMEFIEAFNAVYYHSDLEGEAFDQWLWSCKTPKDAKKAHDKVSQRSNLKKRNKAFSRWVRLCETPGDAKEAFEKAYCDKFDNRRNEAFDRWLMLCTTISEVRKVYNKTYPDRGSGRNTRAKEKLIRLGGSV